jgi:hypothetical protein
VFHAIPFEGLSAAHEDGAFGSPAVPGTWAVIRGHEKARPERFSFPEQIDETASDLAGFKVAKL